MSKRRTKSPPFVMLPRWVTHCPAWRHLDPPARALYLELRERFNGYNNGMIGFGAREAAAAINVSRNTANRAFQRLTQIGFIEPTVKSGFSINGRRATEWLLTELPDDRTGHRAAKTFATWQPEKTKASPTSKPDGHSDGTQRRQEANRKSLRHSGGTYFPQTPDFASHVSDTSRSTTSPGAARADDVAPPSAKGARVNGDGQAGGMVQISDTLAAILDKAKEAQHG